jgi:hypothetical protein
MLKLKNELIIKVRFHLNPFFVYNEWKEKKEKKEEGL